MIRYRLLIRVMAVAHSPRYPPLYRYDSTLEQWVIQFRQENH